jgi:hypothetical protein
MKAIAAVQRRHQAIVSPWKEAADKPTFEIKVEYRSRLMIGSVKVKGEKAEKANITVWQLLEHGTKIRFMDVSPDWISKTQPGQLSSGAGQGHTLDLNFEEPNPGIIERQWGKGVAEDQQEATDDFVREGWKNGFRQAIR